LIGKLAGEEVLHLDERVEALGLKSKKRRHLINRGTKERTLNIHNKRQGPCSLEYRGCWVPQGPANREICLRRRKGGRQEEMKGRAEKMSVEQT